MSSATPAAPAPSPSLTQWAEQALTALLQAQSEAAFDYAFATFFARNVNITVNGRHVSREQYMHRLIGEHPFAQSASVEVQGAVEVPDADVPAVQDPALVGLFYVAKFNRAFLVRDTPAQNVVSSSLNLTIAHEKSVSDRRVVALNQVFAQKAAPVVLQRPTRS